MKISLKNKLIISIAGLALTVTATYCTYGIIKNLNYRGITDINYQGIFQPAHSSLEYSVEQLFVSSNPRLYQDFESNGYAYVIAHAGYSTYNRAVSNLVKNNVEKYGDYTEYSQNIAQLIKYLENSEELTIFPVEEKDFYNKDIPEKKFQPFNSSFIIVTRNGNGTFKKYVATENGKERQDPDWIYSFLKSQEIEEVRFAGEWTWYDGLACLGHLADNFYKKGFDIKGVEGCIYPVEPGINDKILDELYTDTVIPKCLANPSR